MIPFVVNVDSFSYELNRKPAKLLGSREEHILYWDGGNAPPSQALLNVSNEIKSKSAALDTMDMIYASIIIAKKNSTGDFDAHTDSVSPDLEFVRSLTYLTDVPDDTHGPIKFSETVLGIKGTTVTYGSNVLHSGLPNTSNDDRVALTIIFRERGLLRVGVGTSGCDLQQCVEYCADETMNGWCIWSECDCSGTEDSGNKKDFWIFISLSILVGLGIISSNPPKYFFKN
jgi:hypothetical protein